MANEVKHRHTATGSTLYFTIRNTSGQMWNTAGTPNFETLTVANWGDYDVALSESPASSYFYVGTFPAISGNMVAGWYYVEVYEQAGGSPAIGDSLLFQYFGYWDGTTFKFWGNDSLQIEGADPSDTIRDAVVDDATRIDASALNTASGAIGSNGSGLTEAGGTGDHLTALPWNASWDAEVQSEVADALGVYDPPTNTEMEARTLAAASYATAANQTTLLNRTGYVDGFTYYHPGSGNSGQVVGTDGTIDNPVDNDADLIAIGTARGLLRYKYLKPYTGQVPTNYLGEGGAIDVSNSLFDLNDTYVYMNTVVFGGEVISYLVTTEYTTFRNGSIYFPSPSKGDSYHNIRFYQGGTQSFVPVSGDVPPYMSYCGMPAKFQFQTNFAADTWAKWYGCYLNGNDDSLELDINAKTVRLQLDGWVGDLVISNMAAGSEIKVYGYNGRITIDASCTGGTVRHSSHMEVTNNGSASVDLVSEPGSVSGFTTAAKAELRTETETGAAAALADPANLAKFVTEDTGETSAAAGSVAKLAQGAASGLDAQAVRDAMKLAPSAGDPATGSVDKHLDTIEAGGGSSTVSAFTEDAIEQLVGSRITLTQQPFVRGRPLRIVKGDSGSQALSTHIYFTWENPPDIDGSDSITFEGTGRDSADTFSWDASYEVVSATEGKIIVEWTTAESEALDVDTYDCRIVVTFAGGDVFTPVVGVEGDEELILPLKVVA